MSVLEFLEWDSRFQLRENGEAVSLNESIPSPRLVVDVWTSILPGIMGQDHDDPVKSSTFPRATTLALDLSSECLSFAISISRCFFHLLSCLFRLRR